MNDAGNSGAPGPPGSGGPPAPRLRPTRHTPIVIRRFDATEWQVYRRVRLTALADAPNAFGSTLAAEQARPDAHCAERLRARIDSVNDLPLLAVVGDDPSGLAWGKIDAARPSTAYVYQMWVAPTHRRLGIGAALLARVIDWARNQRATEIVLSVTQGDSPARGLYGCSGRLPQLLRPCGVSVPGSLLPVQRTHEQGSVEDGVRGYALACCPLGGF